MKNATLITNIKHNVIYVLNQPCQSENNECVLDESLAPPRLICEKTSDDFGTTGSRLEFVSYFFGIRDSSDKTTKNNLVDRRPSFPLGFERIANHWKGGPSSRLVNHNLGMNKNSHAAETKPTKKLWFLMTCMVAMSQKKKWQTNVLLLQISSIILGESRVSYLVFQFIYYPSWWLQSGDNRTNSQAAKKESKLDPSLKWDVLCRPLWTTAWGWIRTAKQQKTKPN